jgi:hypothetical protein
MGDMTDLWVQRFNAMIKEKESKFSSPYCNDMFFGVELICTSSICHDLDIDCRTM